MFSRNPLDIPGVRVPQVEYHWSKPCTEYILQANYWNNWFTPFTAVFIAKQTYSLIVD
jgi:hypothetical protein